MLLKAETLLVNLENKRLMTILGTYRLFVFTLWRTGVCGRNLHNSMDRRRSRNLSSWLLVRQDTSCRFRPQNLGIHNQEGEYT